MMKLVTDLLSALDYPHLGIVGFKVVFKGVAVGAY